MTLGSNRELTLSEGLPECRPFLFAAVGIQTFKIKKVRVWNSGLFTHTLYFFGPLITFIKYLY